MLPDLMLYGCGDLSLSIISVGDLKSNVFKLLSLGYGLPGEMPEDKGESAHRFMGLSASVGLCV